MPGVRSVRMTDTSSRNAVAASSRFIAALSSCPVVVDVLDLQGVLLDEVAARLNFFTHERAEHLLRRERIVELNAQQRPPGRVERCVPELLAVHFAQALEAGHLHALLAELAHLGDQHAQVRQYLLLALGLQEEARDPLTAGDARGRDEVGRFQAQLSQALEAAVDALDLVQLLDREDLAMSIAITVGRRDALVGTEELAAPGGRLLAEGVHLRV